MTAIVCVDKNWAIGHRILFHISADLKHFRALTTGKTVVMGGEIPCFSLPGGRPLQVGERACVTAMVASEPKPRASERPQIELVKLRVVDESAALELTYFNQSYLKNTFHVGESYTFYGTVEGRCCGGR